LDFTTTSYRKLLATLRNPCYTFQTFQGFLKNVAERVVILRHDVDRLPGNALEMAKLEHGMGVVATYYFRAVPESWDEDVMKEITSLGHEIGYHYENLTTCGGAFRLAIDDFRLNLEKLRKIYAVKTICMHGSPLSKWDNRDLWRKYDYRDFGIVGDKVWITAGVIILCHQRYVSFYKAGEPVMDCSLKKSKVIIKTVPILGLAR
jgi:hypothetical protein